MGTPRRRRSGPCSLQRSRTRSPGPVQGLSLGRRRAVGLRPHRSQWWKPSAKELLRSEPPWPAQLPGLLGFAEGGCLLWPRPAVQEPEVPKGEEEQARSHFREVARCEAATEGSHLPLQQRIPPHRRTWPGVRRGETPCSRNKDSTGPSSPFQLSFHALVSTCFSSFFVLGGRKQRGGSIHDGPGNKETRQFSGS